MSVLENTTTRRSFLKTLGIVGGGLIVGVPLTACASRNPYAVDVAGQAELQANEFLQITTDNQIHFYMARSEMGQGVHTGLTTLIAEELDVDPSKITVHHAPAHEAFKNPDFGMQITGGSTSIKAHYIPMRQAGANTRAVILNAAAQKLGVNVNELKTDNGFIINGANNNTKKIPYGDFVELAATLDVPDDAPLKDKSQFKYIGKARPRLDAIAKSTGTAQFGLDVDFPGLYRAVLVRCPVAGGKVKSLDDKAALAMTGVKKVVTIFNGVAVIADQYYQAKQAATQLKVEWESPETLSQFSSDTGKAQFAEALNSDDYDTGHDEGDGAEALEQSIAVIEADYWAPYLAHACMEPLNCTVKIENGRCDIWVGSQSPTPAKNLAAFYTGLDTDDIHIHSTFLGGGFGRRAASDFIAEAAAIAKASNEANGEASGEAIQLIWTREDDTKHDLYRPASMARFKVGVNESGDIHCWNVRRAGPNVIAHMLDEAVDGMMPGFLPDGFVDWMSKAGHSILDGWAVDPSSVEGLFEDYDAPHKEVQHVTLDPGLPVGFWRSVGHSYSGFFKEAMMDEVAHAQKQDPVAYRLKHTKNNPRLNNVIKLAAEKANWAKPQLGNRKLGIAAHASFQSFVAQVADVSVENGEIKINKVTCVIDCGSVVNPEIVKAQMESGINFGITAALYGDITLKDGVVQQSNFHDYPMLRMNEAPEIEVHIVDSNEAPTGVGEPGTPPIAGAIANAVFAATGKRLRSLPLKVG